MKCDVCGGPTVPDEQVCRECLTRALNRIVDEDDDEPGEPTPLMDVDPITPMEN